MGGAGRTVCSVCGTLLEINVFPALWKPIPSGSREGNVVLGGETSCYYHTRKPAAVPCDACGRFLCSLCDVELGRRHLCPRCLETGKTKGTLRTLENRRTLYDGIALSVAIFPMLLIWPTILTAPITLFLVIRFWRMPLSLTPRSRARFVIAALIALGQIGLWTWALLLLLEPA